MKKQFIIFLAASAIILSLLLAGCNSVTEIDDFKEENHITQKLDEVSDEANKALDDITR